MFTYTGERCIPEFMDTRIQIYQQHLSRYTFALLYARRKKVLDAACGCGFGTNLLYDIANEITGIDNCKEAIEYAREKYNGRFEIIDLEKEFVNEEFDIIISFETIEHLSNPDFFLENVRKKSKQFLFSIPISHRRGKFHKYAYDIDDVKNLIHKHFDHITWFQQIGMVIGRGFGKCEYLLGHTWQQ